MLTLFSTPLNDSRTFQLLSVEIFFDIVLDTLVLKWFEFDDIEGPIQ